MIPIQNSYNILVRSLVFQRYDIFFAYYYEQGKFRASHSRIISNAEEIAFYNGEKLELSILNRHFFSLINHINNTYKIRIFSEMFEDLLIKYVWSAFGLVMCSIPVFFPKWSGLMLPNSTDFVDEENKFAEIDNIGLRTKGFITNRR